MSIWDEIKNLPDLKPYVYGLKKEYENKIKELINFLDEVKGRIDSFEYDVNQSSYIQEEIDEFLKQFKGK